MLIFVTILIGYQHLLPCGLDLWICFELWYFTRVFLGQYLSVDINIFYPVTLTVESGLLLENSLKTFLVIHRAFFRRTLGTRLGSEYKPYWNYNQQIQQARIIYLFIREKGGIEVKIFENLRVYSDKRCAWFCFI